MEKLNPTKLQLFSDLVTIKHSFVGCSVLLLGNANDINYYYSHRTTTER